GDAPFSKFAAADGRARHGVLCAGKLRRCGESVFEGRGPGPDRRAVLQVFVESLRQFAKPGGRGYRKIPSIRGTAAAQRAGAVLLRDEFVEGKTDAGQFVEFGADRLAVAAGDCG